MKCEVRALRFNGVKLPEKPAPVIGTLSVSELNPSAFGRAIKVARLLHTERPFNLPEVLPSLFDVTLLQINNHRIILSGFERIMVNGSLADVMQTWLAEVQVTQGAHPHVPP